jgi:uncharacterized delta-60 repeat protein
LEALEGRCLLTVGALDPTFGTAGQALPVFTGTGGVETFTPRAVAVQADGKILLAGSVQRPAQSGMPAQEVIAVARCNADGTPDTSYGTGGVVIPDFGALESADSDASATGLALQSDGKVVVAGILRSGLVSFGTLMVGAVLTSGVARLNSDGSPDTGFGSGGVVAVGNGDTPFGARAVAMQADGKVVLAGDRAGSFALARLTAGGQLDAQFGQGGLVRGPFTDDFPFQTPFYVINSIALQPDGKIVAAGEQDTTGLAIGSQFALARYEPDGSLDAGFGTGGSVITGNSAAARAVTLQPDGKIVAAGRFALVHPVGESSVGSFIVARYGSDGQLDAGFGTNGNVITFSGAAAYAVAVLPDGTVVLAGATEGQSPTGSDFALAAFDSGGNLNPRWGNGGTATLDFHGNDTALGIGLTPGGDVVLAGPGGGGTDTSGTALARYQGFPARLFDAAQAFAHSPEHYIQFIAGAYQRFLKRAPDELGLNFWVSQMQAGVYTDEQVEAYFLSSQEYIAAHGGPGQSWIIAMYQDLLGRTPTPAEVQSWVNVIILGGSPYDSPMASRPAGSARRSGSASTTRLTWAGTPPRPRSICG